MRNVEPVIEEGGSVEDVHHLRLVALLHDLVRKKGNRGAASVLGIDPRTGPRARRREGCPGGEGGVGAGGTVGGRLGCGSAAGAQRCPGGSH